MIYYNNSNIKDWNFGDDNIIKVYKHGAVCYYKITSGDTPTPVQEPCFAVVDDITQYSDTEFEDVYDKATEKWYKLNNLNEYEEYGVYGSGRTSCEGSTSRLPQGYTEVEYVENTSTAYIDTGAYLNTSNFEVGYTFWGNRAQWGYVHQNVGSGAWITTANDYAYMGCFDSSYRVAISSYLTSDENTIVYTHSGVTVNGTSISKNLNLSGTDNLNASTLLFFAWYDFYRAGVEHSFNSKIKSFYLKNNGILVRDFVPCKRDSDNKYGMYDLVTDTFYLSPNNVDFSGGSPVTPTDCVTTYNGKLTIDDGYEYEWNGSSWVNLGEVSGSSRVPIGYTEVEYIENTTTGTNYYIDTQFKPNQDTRVTIEAQASVLNNNPRIFGSGPWNGLAFVSNIENASPQKFYFKYGQTSSWYTTNIQADTNKHTFDLNKNSYYIDGVLANTASTSTFQLTTNLGIFNAPATSLFSDAETFIGKVFSCKIYDNRTLIRDYVPCKRDSDSKSGLYDVVNDVFYTAVNTSYNFTLGAETGTTEYPVYYDEKSDPLDNLTFSSMTEAESYECPWVGMHATIDGDKYVFSGDSISGYEWVYQSSRLPQGYTEVEYIENTGTTSSNGAYLNLGLPLYNTIGNSFVITSRLKSEFYSASGYDDLETIINSESVSSPYYGFVYRYAHSTHNIELASNPSNHATLSTTANTDGTTSITISCNSTTVTDQVPLGLFASYNANYNTPYRFAKATIYSLTVVKNGDTVRDLVPCKRDSDDKYGMYDIVNDVFYTSPNGNNFIAGNPI